MSGRFSNTSAKPALAGEVAELRARVGDDGEPAPAVGALPRPLEVAARLDRGARLRRRDVQGGGRVALEAEPRDGRRVGGVEHVEPRATGRRVAAMRASTSGKRLEPPMPITSTCSMPSTRASQRLVSAGRSARTSSITGIHPSRSASSVGSSRQSVWSPSNRRADRVAVEQVLSDGRGRRRRSRSRCCRVPRDDVATRSPGQTSGHAIAWAASVAAATISSTTSPVWARPGNITS